jgi:hypothetical protein
MLSAVLFYVLFLGGFTVLNAYFSMDIFHLFFYNIFETTTSIFNWKIIAGSTMFFLAQYLLRYGIGVAINSFAGFLKNLTITGSGLFFSILYYILGGEPTLIINMFIALLMVAGLFEENIKRAFKAMPRLANNALFYTLSKAHWVKQRETYSLLAWFSAFPRWAGGFLQKMNSIIAQEIGELGPLSIFAKEVRAQNARFYTIARFAAIFIVLIPISSILGFSPFEGVLVKLLIIALFFNQVQTLNGLIFYLKSRGFNWIGATIGAIGVSLVSFVFGFWHPSLVYFGFFIGGFSKPISHWLQRRGIDFVRWPKQLVIHTLGQRLYQSLKFDLGGDSLNGFRDIDMSQAIKNGGATFLNIRTAFIFWGLFLYALYMTAITFNLTILNVVLLYPFIIFSVGVMLGPFVTNVPKGDYTPSAYLFRVFGWGLGAGVLLGLKSIASVGVAGSFASLFAVGLVSAGLLVWVGLGNRIRFSKKVKDSRIFSDFSRSFVLSFFSLLPLYWVPAYRMISVEGISGYIYHWFSSDVFAISILVIVGIFAFYGLGRATEWFEYNKFYRRGGLKDRFHAPSDCLRVRGRLCSRRIPSRRRNSCRMGAGSPSATSCSRPRRGIGTGTLRHTSGSA